MLALEGIQFHRSGDCDCLIIVEYAVPRKVGTPYKLIEGTKQRESNQGLYAKDHGYTLTGHMGSERRKELYCSEGRLLGVRFAV